MLHACFIPIALCFVYTSWCFYAFSGTNLLTRCHSVSSYFLLFFYSRFLLKEIYSELDKTKAEVPILLTRRWSPKERQRRALSRPHHRVAQPQLWPRHRMVWAPRVPTDLALSSINSLHRENPKIPSLHPWKVLYATAVDPSSKGSRSSSRHPAREGNHHRMPSSSPCLPPELCVSSLSLDYGSIAVARWLSSPICASCLDLVSCLSWSRSSYCNSTCCVC
jgi:hypothetical protein